MVALVELADEQLLVQYWHSQFLSLHVDSKLHAFCLEVVEILRRDLQHDDDNIEVHLLNGRVPFLGECLAASSLP